MQPGIVIKAREDVFSTGRQILAELRDQKSDARRVGAIIEWLPSLARVLRQTAQKRLGDRGRVNDTVHAITLIGFERLEGLVRTYLKAEYQRRTGKTMVSEHQSVLDVSAPTDSQEMRRYGAI